MGTDEADIDKAYRELDDCHYPVMVAHDVKDIVLVADGINRVEVLLDIGKARPPAAFHHAHPDLECNQGVRMLFSELLDGLFCEYSHIFNFYVAKVQKNSILQNIFR